MNEVKPKCLTNTVSGQRPILQPHQVGYQYGLTPYRHFSKFSTMSKSEQFLSEKFIGQLTCHKQDVYPCRDDESDEEESAYVYSMQFSPIKGLENFLAVANEEGVLTIQDTDKSGSNSIVATFEAHPNAIFDVSWNPDSVGKLQVATASGDQSVKVFELSTDGDVGEDNPLRTFRGYTRSVKCVEFAHYNGNLLATGGRENNIIIWDMRMPDSSAIKICGAHFHTSSGAASAGSRKSAKKESFPSSVTAIQFQDENNLISCSDTDGLIKVSTYFFFSCNLKHPHF